MVDRVKRSESGMVSNPVTTTPDATVAEVDHLCATYRVSGLPVIDGDGVLVGIITNRDMRFVSDFEKASTLVRDVMTKMPLITAPVGIDPDDATRRGEQPDAFWSRRDAIEVGVEADDVGDGRPGLDGACRRGGGGRRVGGAHRNGGGSRDRGGGRAS